MQRRCLSVDDQPRSGWSSQGALTGGRPSTTLAGWCYRGKAVPPARLMRPPATPHCASPLVLRVTPIIPGNRAKFGRNVGFPLISKSSANIMMAQALDACPRSLSHLNVWLAPMDTSHLAEHAGAAGSFFASIFVVATLSMRTMIPLRVFAILTNILLIATAIPTHNYATMALHTVLLPLNTYRLHQMLQLVRDVKKSVNSDLSMEWLKPFMTERKCTPGEVLFYKDEKAEDMFYIVSGRFKLVESGLELPVGAIVGEFGMLSPSNLRTQTLECVEAGIILSVTYSKVEELYVQNPAFGFYFLRLFSSRLFENIGKLEQRLAQQAALATASAVPKPA